MDVDFHYERGLHFHGRIRTPAEFKVVILCIYPHHQKPFRLLQAFSRIAPTTRI